jgi:tetratricopeptide (TPR) repeat protein
MKTKETAFTLPVVAALYEFVFFRGDARRRLLYLLPLALTMLIVPFSVMDLLMPTGEALSEATRTQIEITRETYLFTQFRVMVTYLRLLFLPVNQNLDYDYPLYDSFFTSQVFLSFLFLGLIFTLAVLCLVRFRRGGTAWQGLAVFGGLWFFVTLSVESSVIALADVIFEHRLYLPSVGIFTAMSAGAFVLQSRLAGKASRVALIFMMVLIPLLLSASTYARNEIWRSETGLWMDVIEKSPGKARGHNALGLGYWNNGQPEKSIKYYMTALELDPDYSKAYNNRGVAYGHLKQYPRAIHDLDRAIELKHDYYEAYNNRGIVYRDLKQYQRALLDFNKAIELDHDFNEAYNNRGVAYRDLKQYQRALLDFDKAIELNPGYAEAFNNRGLTYWDLKEYQRVIEDYERAIALDPDFAMAYYNRGLAYGRIKQYRQAIRDYDKAIELNPNYAEAYNNRGFVYMSVLGKEAKACEDWKQACEMGICENYDLAKSRGICE